MTRINHLHVSGFKAIEQLEVEPGQINLITGRNNAGKTSFLQSLDLVFNPGSIYNFRENLDKVVNEDHGSSSISVEFSKKQQTLNSFTSDGWEPNSRELKIKQPDDGEVLEGFFGIIDEVMEINDEYPIRIHSQLSEVFENADPDAYHEIFQNTLRESIADLPEDLILSKMKDNMVLLDINSETYTYVHLGEEFNDIRDRIESDSVERLLSSVNREWEDKEQFNQLQRVATRNFHNMLSPRFGGSRFLGQSPPEMSGVNLISDPIADPDDLELDQENAAVRVSDIEDYLKSNQIVENLNDFSFDRLVFKENDSKDEIPYEFMGSGFRTIVGILWELFDMSKQGDVLLLEEPDIHMHPGYVEELIRELTQISKERGIQIFITSHNVDLIEGFFSSSLRREYGDFLVDNFQLMQMSGKVPRMLEYRQALEEVEDVQADLRGI